MEQNTGMINKGIVLQKKIGTLLLSILFVGLMFTMTGCAGGNTDTAGEADMPQAPIEGADVPEAGQAGINIPSETPGAVGNVVDIETDSGNDKMVSLSLDSVGRANPFVPTNDSSAQTVVQKNELPKFDLPDPPSGSEKDSDASKIVTTKISGIMFDKYNPSAIINIENTDYLVRSGDVINGYKILAISPKTVTVQLGSNVYKAGVGELIAKDEGLNYNEVSNLSSKFGGAGNIKK